MALSAAEKELVLVALLRRTHEEARGVVRPATLSLCSKAAELLQVDMERGRRHQSAGSLEAAQLALDLRRRLPQKIPRRGRTKWAKYDFKMVLKARTLRGRGVTYKDIAESLNTEFGTTISWITIRDWTVQAYRVTG